MTKLYVTEYAEVAIGPAGRVSQVPVEPAIAEQVVSFTGTAGVSAAFNEKTRLVRIQPDGIASILFGTAPTSTTASQRMIAGQTEYKAVVPGRNYKVSAVDNT